jgi:hypothetical protein
MVTYHPLLFLAKINRALAGIKSFPIESLTDKKLGAGLKYSLK